MSYVYGLLGNIAATEKSNCLFWEKKKQIGRKGFVTPNKNYGHTISMKSVIYSRQTGNVEPEIFEMKNITDTQRCESNVWKGKKIVYQVYKYKCIYLSAQATLFSNLRL